jgi:hypothetical protein
MGRTRTKDHHLPQRLFLARRAYLYATWQDGECVRISFGRDEAYAIEQANKLNALKRKDRLKVLGAYRAATGSMREMLLERDGHKCVYCGARNDLGIDHIIPYSQGGSTKPFNLVIACGDCNSLKGDGDPREHIATMLGARELLWSLLEKI